VAAAACAGCANGPRSEPPPAPTATASIATATETAAASASATETASAGTASASSVPAASASSAAAPATKALFVDAALVDCEGEGIRKCLRVRESEKDKWILFYDRIEGFEHQPGNAYELRVEVSPQPGPPAGGSALRYRLLEVVSKRKVP
jgi:hypothetical protein